MLGVTSSCTNFKIETFLSYMKLSNNFKQNAKERKVCNFTSNKEINKFSSLLQKMLFWNLCCKILLQIENK